MNLLILGEAVVFDSETVLIGSKILLAGIDESLCVTDAN